jgi:hypothetical protein
MPAGVKRGGKDMEREFSRHVGSDLIEGLKKEPLWAKLEPDCRSGDVFLAIRQDYISFYHQGGGLFTFDKNGFKTHVKYAAVADVKKDTYISEGQLEKIPLIKTFADGYGQIKNNCALYSDEEAEGVGNLLEKNSYLHDKNIFVLDLEVAFRKDDRKQDRIDILLYDNELRTLRFVEAKHFSNGDLRSKSTPKVVEQIGKYEEQLKLHEAELVAEYGKYIDGLNQIFGISLNTPKTLDMNVSLLIFGFDDAQKNSYRFNDLVKNNPEYDGISLYCKGDPKDLSAETIWKMAK